MLTKISRATPRLLQQQACSSRTASLRSLNTWSTNNALKAWRNPCKNNRVNSASKRREYSDSAQRDRAQLGVFSPASAGFFLVVGVGLYFYFRYEKQKQEEERVQAREARAFGRPSIGGPFSLSLVPAASTAKSKSKEPAEPTTYTEKDLLGKWTLLYFGFTNCPDICPAEMDKMGDVIIALEGIVGPIFEPVFVTVDPARDSPDRIASYLQDFHPKFVGLYGAHDEIKKACKAYRVYFSTPPDADPEGDYLVDHSIFIYLIDPRGEFVEAFGQSTEKEAVVERIQKEVNQWEKEFGKKV